MCGRFTLYAGGETLAREFGVGGFPPESRRFNIAPTQPVVAVRAASGGPGREVALLRWGLVPAWSRDPAASGLINARSETAGEKPSFRDPFRRRRCLIPASGFYEWRRSGRVRQPYYIRMADGRPFAFAGLWERRQGSGGDAVGTCAILTTGANALVAPIHDRMPVILDRAEYEAWLDPSLQETGLLSPLLVPFPEGGMVAYPVAPRVNSPATDDEGCITPLP